MVATAEKQKMIGQRLKRREDPRLMIGQGRFLDDIVLRGMVHAAILRSPHAHARIRSIDTSAARSMPGVVDIFTGEDIDLPAMPLAWPAGRGTANNANTPLVIARDEIHWTGESIAVVVAETAAQARDAAEQIEIDLEILPATVDAEAATFDGAPQLHENAPNNIAFHWTCGNAESTNEALDQADVVVRQRIRNQRLIPTAIETRGAICQFDSGTDEFTFWLSSQAPHVHRLLMAAFVLGVPEQNIRVIAPDIGGAFGAKIFLYSEYLLVGWIARKLGRPVKWIEGRSEAHHATTHGRDHVTDIEVAARRDGTVTGLKVTTWANIGAYYSTVAGGIPTTLYGRMVAGCYKIPNIAVDVYGTFTNTAMVDAYRGAGRPEATFVIERTMDLVARELGLDPVEVRRKNFIPSDAFPYDTGIGMLPYDSGEYDKALDRALEILDYSSLRLEQARRRENGDRKQLGVGFSTYVEVCGLAPSKWIGAIGEGWGAGLFESANVRVHLTGKVVVTTGTMPHGQGHETTFAQIVSDRLGVPYDDVQIKWGDTLGTPFGYGSYGSRSLAVGGEALLRTANKINDKARKLAAHMLEVGENDVEISDGRAFVKGAPDQSKTIQEIALAASVAYSLPEGMEPYLDETTYFDPPNCTFPFGTHIAVVEVDRESGTVEVVRYVAVDDVGHVINPLVVDGQVQGGIVQGMGQALWEGAVYDDDGQLLTGTLMEYAIPRAEMIPMMELDRTVTPSPVTSLGTKGAGEAGTIASTPAMANAVIDALSPLGIRHIDMPLTPPRVWAAIQEAREQGGN
jgi:aerobic carbon-monoxide dehydrogenase large subunit